MSGRERKRRRYWSKRALRRELSTGRSVVSFPTSERGPDVTTSHRGQVMLLQDVEDESSPMPAIVMQSSALQAQDMTGEPHIIPMAQSCEENNEAAHDLEDATRTEVNVNLDMVERGALEMSKDNEEELGTNSEMSSMPFSEERVQAGIIARRSRVAMLKAAQVLLKGYNMAASSLLVGTSRGHVTHYKSTRRMVYDVLHTHGVRKNPMPSYDSVLRNVYPVLFDFAFASHNLVRAEVNVNAAGVSTHNRQMALRGESPTASLLIVSPSTWLSRDADELYRCDPCLDSPSRRYPQICSYENTLLARFPSFFSGESIFSEMHFHNEAWHLGRYIRQHDTVQITFSIKQEDILSELNRSSSILINGCEATMTVKVGQSDLVRNGELGEGLGDLVIQLHCTRNDQFPSVQAQLHYHMGYFTLGKSLSLWLKCGNAEKGEIRCRSISMIDRFPNHLSSAPLSGRLQDGRLFLRIPFLLFADDFSTMGGFSGKSGGCYMMPLSVPTWARRGMHSVRAIGLSPPGVSSNTTLCEIVDDVVQCATTGVEVELSTGRKVVVFGELVGFLGDYPGEAHTLDVMGPTANAPCTLCTFQRASPAVDDYNSRYAYTTSVHSGDPSFRRTKEKMRMIRAGNCDPEDLRSIGIRPLSEAALKKLPLHKMADALEEARDRIPLTATGQRVVSPDFDPYQNTLVGPSHLFYGLSQNILEAMVRQCTPEQRQEVNMLFFKSLRNTGILDEGSFIHADRPKLHSMTINHTLSVLLVAPWAFSSVLQRPFTVQQLDKDCILDRVLRALYLFRDLVYDTKYTPSKEIDGCGEVKIVEEDNGEKRHIALRQQCVEYMKTVECLCGEAGDLRTVLDKPNLHRLLELYVHTLPRLGHVRMFDELPFEAFHQPLKRALGRSNRRDGHVYSMRSILANEWRKRVGDAARSVSSLDNLTDDDCSLLVQGTFGSTILLRDGSISAANVRSAFTRATLQEFRSFGEEHTLLAVRNSVWTVVKSSRVFVGRNIEQHARMDAVDVSIRVYLLELVGRQQPGVSTIEMVEKYRTAVLGTITNADSTTSLESQIQRARYRKYNAIAPGEVLQVLCSLSGQALQAFINRDGVHILPPAPGTGPPSFWMVVDLYKVRGCPFIYARVIPMMRMGGDETVIDTGLYTASSTNAVILLQLSTSCRKALPLKACDEYSENQCGDVGVESITKADVTSSSLHAHRWVIYGSRRGFPPRSG